MLCIKLLTSVLSLSIGLPLSSLYHQFGYRWARLVAAVAAVTARLSEVSQPAAVTITASELVTPKPVAAGASGDDGLLA